MSRFEEGIPEIKKQRALPAAAALHVVFVTVFCQTVSK
jgi:hypothetical protein